MNMFSSVQYTKKEKQTFLNIKDNEIAASNIIFFFFRNLKSF